MYQPRTYRHWVKDKDLVSFSVVVKETDLYIRASTNLKRKAHKLVLKYRDILERYIDQHPLFLTSLEPLPLTEGAPHIVKEMCRATAAVGVGPMASVAGAMAEFVGEELLAHTPEIIIENGGDIYLKSLRKRVVGIYAGKSAFTGKIGLEIDGADTPAGISTSSGTVGHSLSFGKADAATVIAESATLSDAVATALGNLVKGPADIAGAIDFGKTIPGVKGIVIIMGDNIGLWGQMKLCQTST